MDVKKLMKRLEHANKQHAKLEKKYGTNPSKTYNFFGGWSLGYWAGRVSVLEDLIDQIKERAD